MRDARNVRTSQRDRAGEAITAGGSPWRARFAFVVSITAVSALTSSVFAGEPAWWTQMKNNCRASGGTPASEYYNDWVAGGGCKCNGASTGSGSPTCSGAATGSATGSGSPMAGALASTLPQLASQAGFALGEAIRQQAEEAEAAQRAAQEAQAARDREALARWQATQELKKEGSKAFLLSALKDPGPGYGIKGLPGLYTNGLRAGAAGSSDAVSAPTLTPSGKTAEATTSPATGTPPSQPTDSPKASPAPAAAGEAHVPLPSSDGITAVTSGPAPTDTTARAPAGRTTYETPSNAQPENAAAGTSLDASGAAPPNPSATFGALTEMQKRSQIAAAAPSGETASVQARGGFDSPAGGSPIGGGGGGRPLGVRPEGAPLLPNSGPPNSGMVAAQALVESEFFYALQGRRTGFQPTGEGHPIDASGPPPPDPTADGRGPPCPRARSISEHGLLGGTTWTFGYRVPHASCDANCRRTMNRAIDQEFALHCNRAANPQECLKDKRPFDQSAYDFVLSVASERSVLADLASRVVWDGATYGKFSRQNQELFASLKGRHYERLDCHSNGAMLCLAALRSCDVTASEVRLFGPQINAEAARRWSEFARDTGTRVRIFINDGDPVPAAAWAQPPIATAVPRAATLAVMTNPVLGPAKLASAAAAIISDARNGDMDRLLGMYGLSVTRWECSKIPDVRCHEMEAYEARERAAGQLSPAAR